MIAIQVVEVVEEALFFSSDLDSNEIYFTHSPPGEPSLFSETSVTVSDDIKVSGVHIELKEDLIEHQWDHFRW